MTPEMVKLLVDVVTILIGFFAIWQARSSAIGGLFGRGMSFILLGFFVLTVNHALDTVFLASFLKQAGHTADFLQPPNVHRYINLIGFIFMTVGFATIKKSGSK